MKCLAAIHPMRWPRPATHRGNRGQTNPACIVMRMAKTRAEVAMQKASLARARPQEARKPEARAVEPRRPYEYRNRTYALRSSEIQTMTNIGKFRAVDAKDLREFAYGGDGTHLEADLTNLRRQGLIAEREIPHQETAPRRLVALTKQGHRLLLSHEECPEGPSHISRLREAP